MRIMDFQKIGKQVASTLILLVLGVTVSRTPANADTFNYSGQRRQIKACVLVSNAAANTFAKSGTTTGPDNVVPHVFYVLDSRTDAKPAGWEFINPLAPGNITTAIYNRWQNRQVSGSADPAFQSGTPESVIFRVGAPLTKNLGAYWEVNLDTVTDSDLRQFDIVLIAVKNRSSRFLMTTDERERLRRYVDGGGTVWFECEGTTGGSATVAEQFFINTQFNPIATGSALPVLASQFHPLVNYPFGITLDVHKLGYGAGTIGNWTTLSQVGKPALPLNGSIVVPIVYYGGPGALTPMISAGELGAGHVLISGAGIASDISGYIGGSNTVYGPNTGVVSGKNLINVLPTDLKFAYNIVAWTSSVPTASVNARRTGSTRENIGSNLGVKWATVAPAAQNKAAYTGLGSGVAINKRLAFVATGDNILHAYDMFPAEDLDGDLNSDDGIQDHIFGAPYDEVWNNAFPSGVRLSTPTIAPLADTGGNPFDVVTLTDSMGTTYAFDALPYANGRISGKAHQRWITKFTEDFSTSLIVKGIPVPAPSPALSEGVLFTLAFASSTSGGADRGWFVQPLDPATGTNLFGGATSTVSDGYAPTPRPTMSGLSPIIGNLTVGYVRDTNSGAIDKLVYAPTRAKSSTITTPAANSDALAGLWFSTRGEPMMATDTNTLHTRFTVTAGERRYVPWWAPPTTAGSGGLDSRVLPVLHVIHRQLNTNGSYVVTGVQDLHYVNSGGSAGDFTVEYTTTSTPAPPSRLGGYHAMFVDITNTTVQITDNDQVFADYTVDWPGGPVGTGPAPTDPELDFVFNGRGSTVYNPSNGANPSEYHLVGPPALSAEDRLFYLVDMEPDTTKATPDVQQPTRIYCVSDQFATTPANQFNPNNQNTAVTPWAWWPNDGGAAGQGHVAPRLANSDPWQPNAPSLGSGNAVTGFQAIGSPVVSNGVVYVLGSATFNNRSVAVVLALNANPTNTFTIPVDEATLQTLNTTGVYQNVTLYQYDLSKTSEAGADPNQTISMTGTTSGSENFTAMVTNDTTNSSGTLTITIKDFHTASGDFNAALPIYYSVGGGGGAANATGPAPLTNAAGYGILDNVIWYMVIPTGTSSGVLSGNPTSSPTVHGNVMYFCTDAGEVTAVDLPTTTGGQQATVYNGSALRVHRQGALVDNKGITLVQSGMTPMIYPPIGTTNTLLVGTPQGVTAFDNQETLITDANRLLLVNHAGDAVWEMSGTLSVAIAGGGANSTGQISGQPQAGVTKIPLSRPNVAQLIGPNDFLVADTGNNRIIQVDRAGFTTVELRDFQNDLQFLRPGDPKTLNQPSDVQTFTQTGSGITLQNKNVGDPNGKPITYTYNCNYYAVHYLIADSGNFRLLEIVDVYDLAGNPVVMKGSNGVNVTMLHQCIFVTQSYAEQNLHLRYRTIQQFYDPTDPRAQNNQLPIYLIAAVSNVRQGGTDPGTVVTGANTTTPNVSSPGGSLVVLTRDYNYSPQAPAKNQDGDVATIINAIALPNDRSNINSGILTHQPISNPTWFKKFDTQDPNNPGNAVPRYLLADDNGVYVLAPVVVGGVSEAVVEWQLTAADYYRMTGRPLQATSIVRLSAADYDANTNKFYPHYLITNHYAGKDNVPDMFLTGLNQNQQINDRGDIKGEVFEVRGKDYYQLTSSTSPLNDGYLANSANWLYFINSGGTSYVKNQASSIVWMCPNETIPTNSTGNPIAGKIVRSIGTSAAAQSYLLTEPTFSDRPF